MKKTIVAIIEARMTSSRLPGKHLFEVLGKPILNFLKRKPELIFINQSVVRTGSEEF